MKRKLVAHAVAFAAVAVAGGWVSSALADDPTPPAPMKTEASCTGVTVTARAALVVSVVVNDSTSTAFATAFALAAGESRLVPNPDTAHAMSWKLDAAADDGWGVSTAGYLDRCPS